MQAACFAKSCRVELFLPLGSFPGAISPLDLNFVKRNIEFVTTIAPLFNIVYEGSFEQPFAFYGSIYAKKKREESA